MYTIFILYHILTDIQLLRVLLFHPHLWTNEDVSATKLSLNMDITIMHNYVPAALQPPNE